MIVHMPVPDAHNRENPTVIQITRARCEPEVQHRQSGILAPTARDTGTAAVMHTRVLRGVAEEE